MAYDFKKILAALLISLCVGLVINASRTQPLSLFYQSPEARLEEAVKDMTMAPTTGIGPDVDLGEMKQVSLGDAALILDARPGIYYRMSHIPSAHSLPRDDFKAQYLGQQKLFEASRYKRVIVYCAGSSCNDSQLVANALEHLGYRGVQVFRGGWSMWQKANLPEEKK